jgi:hypothetical protein
VSGPSLRPTLLNPVFWPEVRRGSERAVRSLADGLAAGGHRPRLVTSYDGRTPRFDREDGLAITRLPRVTSRRLWRAVADDHAAHHALALPLLSADPGDLLHAFYPTDATLAVRAAAAHHAPVATGAAPSRSWSRSWVRPTARGRSPSAGGSRASSTRRAARRRSRR